MYIEHKKSKTHIKQSAYIFVIWRITKSAYSQWATNFSLTLPSANVSFAHYKTKREKRTKRTNLLFHFTFRWNAINCYLYGHCTHSLKLSFLLAVCVCFCRFWYLLVAQLALTWIKDAPIAQPKQNNKNKTTRSERAHMDGSLWICECGCGCSECYHNIGAVYIVKWPGFFFFLVLFNKIKKEKVFSIYYEWYLVILFPHSPLPFWTDK